MKELEVLTEPIELYKVLKLEGMVSNGGEAKALIAAGQVMLNGKVETRKRKKIFSGDVIKYDENEVRIKLK